MRSLLTGLAVVSMLLSVCSYAPVLASDKPAVPTAASIEQLLREKLTNDVFDLPALFPYKGAVMMEFRLVNLDRVTSSRWHAEIDVLFDFGPPPPGMSRSMLKS